MNKEDFVWILCDKVRNYCKTVAPREILTTMTMPKIFKGNLISNETSSVESLGMANYIIWLQELDSVKERQIEYIGSFKMKGLRILRVH